MDGLRVGVDILKKKNFLTPTEIQTPNRIARSLVCIRTALIPTPVIS